MKSQRKKKNHFAPAAYLAGFTASGERDDWIYQHDLSSDRAPSRLKPINAGFERYLYLATEHGLPVNAMEDWFEKNIETPAWKVFQSVFRRGILPPPNTSEFAKILKFVAFMLVRVPKVRSDVFKNFEEHWAKKFAKEMRGRDDFEKWKRTTALQDLAQSYEKVVEGLRDGRLKLTFMNDRFIKEMFVLVKHLRPSLVRRKWSLLVAEDGAETFITSDNPVALALDSGCAKPEEWSLDSPEVILRFPLNRRMAIEGRVGGQPKAKTASSVDVAVFNGSVGMAAHKYVYSSRSDFTVAPDEPAPKLYLRQTLLQDWREKQALPT